MRSFSWWQMVRVLRGLEPGDHDLFGITDNPRPELAPRAVLQRLADGDAVVRGIPFDGQMPQPIPKDAWSHVYFEIRKGWPFAHNDAARRSGWDWPDNQDDGQGWCRNAGRA